MFQGIHSKTTFIWSDTRFRRLCLNPQKPQKLARVIDHLNYARLLIAAIILEHFQ